MGNGHSRVGSLQRRLDRLASVRFTALCCLSVVLFFANTAEAESLRVNPPESVSEELQGYVFRFEQVLRDNGFGVAAQKALQNYDWRLTLVPSKTAVIITAELLLEGKTLVVSPIRNTKIMKSLFQASAVGETVSLVERKFSEDLARYVASIGGGKSGNAPAVRTPVSSWKDVKVYFRPPEARYDEIALLEASSAGSWAVSSQGKMDKVLERLRVEAAKKGGNGVLLVGVGNEYRGSVSTGNVTATDYGNSAFASGAGTSVAVVAKSGSAIAIYVYEGEQSPVEPATETTAPSASTVKQRTDEKYEAILKLDDLRKRGVITDAEFTAEKQKILAGN